MQAATFQFALRQTPVLLRGDMAEVKQWIGRWEWRRTLAWTLVIVAGSALYGAAMGWWRAPLQSAYTAVKFPLVILLTTLGNALLNFMLAPLLGVNFSFRQSLLAVWMSFAIAAAVLAGFAPLLFFIVWNTPAFDTAQGTAWLAYRFMQLAVVAGIAYAGVMANLRLLPLLRAHAAGNGAALRVLFAWLAGNLLLGSQICWVLRPFIGRPQDEVEFLGPVPFMGSLYETVFEAARELLLR